MYNSTKVLTNYILDALQSEIISKSELSRSSGVDRTSLDKYLKGTQTPKLEVLDKLAKVLEKKPWQLIQPKEDKSILEKSIPFELLEEFSKLPEAQKEVILSAFRAMIAVAFFAENPEKIPEWKAAQTSHLDIPKKK